jgi:hypothetical protein
MGRPRPAKAQVKGKRGAAALWCAARDERRRGVCSPAALIGEFENEGRDLMFWRDSDSPVEKRIAGVARARLPTVRRTLSDAAAEGHRGQLWTGREKRSRLVREVE